MRTSSLNQADMRWMTTVASMITSSLVGCIFPVVRDLSNTRESIIYPLGYMMRMDGCIKYCGIGLLLQHFLAMFATNRCTIRMNTRNIVIHPISKYWMRANTIVIMPMARAMVELSLLNQSFMRYAKCSPMV